MKRRSGKAQGQATSASDLVLEFQNQIIAFTITTKVTEAATSAA